MDRYDRVAVALHWLIGVALLAQIAFGLVLDDIAPRGTPNRSAVINLHKSIGLVLGMLIVVRLGWRITHRPPPWPQSLSLWQRRAAVWGHRALYVCMLVMPTAGYIASNFSKHGIKFFGVALPPWGPDLKPVYEFFNGVHVVTAYVFIVLIVGHVAFAIKHLRDRDEVALRMMTWKHS